MPSSSSYRSRTVSLDRAASTGGGGLLLPPLYELMAEVRHTAHHHLSSRQGC